MTNVWFGLWYKEQWGGDRPVFLFTTEEYYRKEKNVQPDFWFKEDIGLPVPFMLENVSDNNFELKEGYSLEAANAYLKGLGFIEKDFFYADGRTRQDL